MDMGNFRTAFKSFFAGKGVAKCDTLWDEQKLTIMNVPEFGRYAELWVFGETLTAGMKSKIAYAKRGRKTIRYFTEDCEEKR